VKVRLRFFAVLKDVVGQDEIEKDVPDGTTARGLLDTMVTEFPKLGRYADVTQVAVNHELVDSEYKVEPEDEIAFLPPVSGG
jgi:molybdopterin converting factor subunit 1